MFTLFGVGTVTVVVAGVLSAFVVVHNIKMRIDIDSYGASDEPSEVASLLQPGISDRSVGAFVFLNNVSLEAGPAPHLFFATGIRGSRILVEFNNQKFDLDKRLARFSIAGIVREFPNSQVGQTKWKLKNSIWKKLASLPLPVYIEALRITQDDKTPA